MQLPHARAVLRSLPLLAAALIGACASSNKPLTVRNPKAVRAILDSAGALPEEYRGPRVRLRVEQDFRNPNNLAAFLRLEDDAYVMVVNVGPDGFAQVVFPEKPADDGFLRGGRSYKIPAFFPGFATNALTGFGYHDRFVAFQRSEFASAMARGPGFVFAIASEEPLNMEAAVNYGMWDEFRLPTDAILFHPNAVVNYYADAVRTSDETWIRGSVARYAGWVPTPARFASGFGRSAYCGYNMGWGSSYWVTDPGFRSSGFLPAPIWTAAFGMDDCGPPRLLIPQRGLLGPPAVVPNTPQVPLDSTTAPEEPTKPKPNPPGAHPKKPEPVEQARRIADLLDKNAMELTPGGRWRARQPTFLARERDRIERMGGPTWARGGTRSYDPIDGTRYGASGTTRVAIDGGYGSGESVARGTTTSAASGLGGNSAGTHSAGGVPGGSTAGPAKKQ